MDAKKSPAGLSGQIDAHDEKEILDFLDGLDIIDSWDDKSIENMDAVKLDRDSENKTGSSLAEKVDGSHRKLQKLERPRFDHNNKTVDTRHPLYLHSPGRERKSHASIRRDVNKTHKYIKNDKVRKVKDYLTKMETGDIAMKPPGTELDNDIDYVLKRREEERRRNTRQYKSRSRSRSKERLRRSPSREYRRKRFTPPKYSRYPNSDYRPHNNSSGGGATPNVPFAFHNAENAPWSIPHGGPPLMPVYYPNIEYQPHFTPPVPQMVPYQPPAFPMVHEDYPPPQVQYDAPYIPPPVDEPLAYPSSFTLPLVEDVPVPTVNQLSAPGPSPQEALDNMLLEGKISMQDYSKLTTKSTSGHVENVKYHELNLRNKTDVLLRCHDAILQLEGLRLPNRLFVPPVVESIPPVEVKYSSPLKRNPVHYSFTSAANMSNTQNKLLISKIVNALGLQNVELKKPKKKVSIREISTQTISADCYTCKIRQMTKNVSVEIQVDRADFTNSCHTQVIHQELASSKTVFGYGANAASAPISLTHLTSAQIVSSLANKAKMLQSSSQPNEPEDNSYYRRFQPSNPSPYQQGHFGNNNPKFNRSGGPNAPYQDPYSQNQSYRGRNN